MNERTVYLNGKYIPAEQATVSVFDRGYLFADAVYEVRGIVSVRSTVFRIYVVFFLNF